MWQCTRLPVLYIKRSQSCRQAGELLIWNFVMLVSKATVSLLRNLLGKFGPVKYLPVKLTILLIALEIDLHLGFNILRVFREKNINGWFVCQILAPSLTAAAFLWQPYYINFTDESVIHQDLMLVRIKLWSNKSEHEYWWWSLVLPLLTAQQIIGKWFDNNGNMVKYRQLLAMPQCISGLLNPQNGKQNTKGGWPMIYLCFTSMHGGTVNYKPHSDPSSPGPGSQTKSSQIELEIAQSEQDVPPFCKESDMTYSWKRQIGLFLRQ